MKKLMIALLVVTLLVTAGLLAVHAVQPEPHATEGVYCENCDMEVLPEAWQEWNFAEGKVFTGHYRLTDDFYGQTETLTIAKNAIVCLDLQGKVYSTEDIKVFTVDGTLSIMDSVGGGMILTTGQSDQLGGFASVSSAGTLNLYGGTVQFVEKKDITVACGGLVYAYKGVVNISGGILQGGMTRPAVIDTKTYKGYGGNVYLIGGATLNMTAGSIIGGMSRLNPEVSITSGYYAVGGNICADGSTVNISGGKVSGGYADREGGNIYLVSGATLKLSDEGVIENGHAYNNGGNISLYSLNNTINITGGKVTGGVAGGAASNAPFTAQGSGGGGNLYVYGASSALNISGGIIDGDIKVEYVGTVTLSGEPTINLGKATGLKLKSGIMVDASGMTGGTVYVDATGTFAENVENAATVATYFKGAIRTAVTADGTTLVATQGSTGYCPCCQNEVTWTPVSGNWTASGTCSTDGHYYLTGLWRAVQTIKADVTLDLNGWAIGAENSWVFSMQGQMDVLDSFGGGQIIGTNNLGSTASYKPVVYVFGGKTFTLHSGTVRRVDPWTTSNAGKQPKTYSGGVIYAADAAVVNIAGGVVRDGIVDTRASGIPGPAGGNIGFNNTKNGNFTMTAGIVMGGEAKDATSGTTTYPGVGGNLFTPGVVTISGGFILDGKAADGGNLFFSLASGVTRTISGGTICGGTATSEGGNIYQNGSSGYTGILNISNARVIYGEAATAGNIYVTYGTVNVNAGGMVLGGTATANGGNIYGAGATIKVAGGNMLHGNAGQRGGNIYFTGSTEVELSNNGKILNGSATNMGGNIGTNSASATVKLLSGTVKGGRKAGTGKNICFYGAATLEIKDASLSGGVYAQVGTVKLSGTARVTGDSTYGIALTTGKLIVADDWTGEAGIKWNEQYSYGDAVADTLGQSEGAYTGKLVYEDGDLPTKPWIVGRDGALVVGTAQLMDHNGEATWYANNAEAVDAYGENTAYLMAVDTNLVLAGGNYTVDLMGQNMTITGTGTVTCFDSGNDTYKTYGSAAINGPDLVNKTMVTVDGKQYVMLEKDSAYTFHRLDMRVNGVSIRPSTTGIYYTCVWNCDDILKADLESFGVALSAEDMPSDDFMNDGHTLWTVNDMADFASGVSKNSVLIQHILKNGEDNDTRGTKEIHALPYVVMDGECLVPDTGTTYSMKKVLELLDDKDTYYNNRAALESFYTDWADAMSGWGFRNIGVNKAAFAEDPAEDKVLRILMLGNSYCKYYADELYGMLAASMPEEWSVEVYNLYKGGCTYQEHYTEWYENGEGLYTEYWVADSTGHKKLSGTWTIEKALAYQNWDYVSLQGSLKEYASLDADKSVQNMLPYAKPLFNRIKDRCPQAKVLWHQTWSAEIGYDDSYTVESVDDQAAYEATVKAATLEMCRLLDLERINSGEAWPIARQSDLVTNLCARLGASSFDGTANSGDGFHDGDIGGGQYLNACVWFESITGQSCVGNTYRPDYTLSEDMIAVLQDAAHQAVAAKDAQ